MRRMGGFASPLRLAACAFVALFACGSALVALGGGGHGSRHNSLRQLRLRRRHPGGGRAAGRRWSPADVSLLARGRRLRTRLTNGVSAADAGRYHAQENARAISTEAALEQLPAKVGEVFLAYQKTHDSAKKDEVLAQLNGVYKNALMIEDTQGLDCVDKRSSLQEGVKAERASLKVLENQLTQVQSRIKSLQTGTARALAEIQSVRTHVQQHHELCEKNRRSHREGLAVLLGDVPKVAEVVKKASASCAAGAGAGSAAPALVECTMPDGSVVVTFKEKALRVLAANLSSTSERLFGTILDRTLHKANFEAAESFLGVRSKGFRSRLRRRKFHGRGRLSLRGIPEHLCTDSPKPACPLFLDGMAAISGAVEDAIEELKLQRASETASCQENVEDSDAAVRLLKQEVDNANMELASAVAEQASIASLRKVQRARLQDVMEEADRGTSDCEARLGDAADTKLSALRLWRVLGSDGAFIGDCEVSDWVPGACSAACGAGGKRNMTRRILSADPRRRQLCPSVTMERACDVGPCPVDGKVGLWEAWSKCSRLCGGGTRTRRRAVLQEAKHGGLPLPETVQEEVCNMHSCDPDCTLSAWTQWSTCSKAFQRGHRLRERRVLQPALGRGTCAALEDPSRREVLGCNEGNWSSVSGGQSSLPSCASALDLVLVADGSGSVADAGFAKTKSFAAALLARLSLAGEAAKGAAVGPAGRLQALPASSGARLGVVTFAQVAKVAHDLSTVRGTLLQSLEALKWPGSDEGNSGTNTAGALSVAREIIERHSERAGTQSVVLVVTDGDPVSSRLVGTEAQRLRSLGVRVVFVAVGATLRRSTLKRWASWPSAENILRVPSYAALGGAAKDQYVTDLLANICPVLVAGR
eukprot:TRINITY_DN5903_c0_g1_i3.p1 TRINITY_DN5903_c0_g1~~TRINITY_DN5903_c0_g1_i3.p1  ORF type:complete len:875 (+),score=184.50 TRINITY_DN5903_c0_g1_i3:51-2675(+)